VAILEFDSNKKVHLVPVTIMLNGDFYDASAYKAAPIPMALDSQTVYEGVRTGVSQGLFTITLAHQVLGNWVGEGNWVPTESKPPEVKKTAPTTPAEGLDKPPVLRRSGADKPKTPAAAPVPAPAPSKPSATQDDSSITVGGKVSDKPAGQQSPPPAEPSDRPVLRRGKPEKTESGNINTKAATAWSVVTTIPAISDAKNETARSYHYVLRSEQEQDLREKVQALAVKALREHSGSVSTASPNRVAKSSKASAAPQFKFQDVQFRAYDPSTTNEPIFVFEANTPVTDKSSGKELPNHVMLVVREDIYADMHVLFSGISDPQHMDSQPRCEFVDVVDAEGDGYGELLFRRTYDSGRAFSLYRVIGNQLWPLFEGKP